MSFSASVAITAEAESSLKLLGEVFGCASWLSIVMGGVEFSSTGGALLFSEGVCEILIDLEEKRPEGGVGKQIVVHVLNTPQCD